MKNLFLILLLSALFSQIIVAQHGSNDPTFNPTDIGFGSGENFNHIVYSTAIQTDGKIVIGGEFTSFNGTVINRIIRLNNTGIRDTTFNPGLGFNSTVRSISIQTDGKIIVGGNFTTYNGITINRIARLNIDGSLDDTFIPPGTGFNNWVYTIAIQSDGTIMVGGVFTSFNGTARNRIARLNANGSLDASFNPGTGFAGGYVNSLVIQSDDKIIAGGGFTSFNGSTTTQIIRLNTNGTKDLSFDAGTGFNISIYSTVNSVKLQNDGKIVAGGNFTSYNGTTINHILRINPNGSLDISFDPGTGLDAYVNAISIQDDGKIIVGGVFTFYNLNARNRIARLNTDGSLDGTFDPGSGFNDHVWSTVVKSDGKIIVGGLSTIFNGIPINYNACLNTNGSLDSSFNPITGFNPTVITTAIQSDEKIIVGGNFSAFNGKSISKIARLNKDGSLDSTFNIGSGFTGNYGGGILVVSIQSDGKIIAGGSFDYYNGTLIKHLARLNSNGSLDTTFNPDPTYQRVESIAIQNDGKIIVAGSFYDRIARLNIDGSKDSTFNLNTTFTNGSIFSIALQDNGKIIVGGSFYKIFAPYNNYIARLNSDGTLDTTFNPGNSFNHGVFTLAIQTDGKIVVGGAFTSYNGTGVKYIARLNSNSSLDTTFNLGSEFNNGVNATAIQTDGKIVVGGVFTSINGTLRNMIARLNADGSLDNSFDPGTGFDKIVRSVSIQSNGKILAVGDFRSFNNEGRNRIARLLSCQTTKLISVSSCDSYTLNGQTYISSGTYTQVIPNANINGCDSILKLILTIDQTSSIINPIACNNYTVNGQTYTSSGTYFQVIPNTTGCDSTITINLTIKDSTSSTINPIVCSSYTENGQTYYVSGTYTQLIENSVGCDSIITINLVTEANASTINTVACNSYSANGQTYTTSGTYLQVIPNAAGCDSTITINLTINESTFSIINPVVCGSYIENNQTFTSSGTYTQVIPNSHGCDSIITINLIINQITDSIINFAACTDYTLNGQTYTSSGTYVQVLPNSTNCDSIITLNLTINSTNSILTETACESYSLYSQTYTTSGTYTQVLINSAGCDSIVTLNLTINTVDVSISEINNTLTANLGGAVYQWVDCDNANQVIVNESNQSFTPSVNGNYAAIVTANNCSDTSSCYVITSIGIGKGTAGNKLKIYPNPSNGNITISSDFPLDNANLRVHSLTGQIVFEDQNLNGNLFHYDMNKIAKGIFFMEINDGMENIRIKLILN
jgi:uncharacterized delta-60 repeat protein